MRLIEVYAAVTRDMSAKASPKKGASRKKRKKGSHDWALHPFEQFLDDVDRLGHLVRLSSAGISVLQAMPQGIEALMKAEPDNITEKTKRLEAARIDAKLAEREVKSGFPVLNSLAVVGLWALFEAAIRTFVSEWLKHKRTAWRAEPIQKLKIRLGEYQSIPQSQRHRYVVELLERELVVGLKGGVSRFEAMLEPFGLSGELPEALRREIYELGQVRNLIVHNASKVDRRFADACPWLKAKIGSEFFVSREAYRRYEKVIAVYTSLIICRIGEHFGNDMSASRLSILEELD